MRHRNNHGQGLIEYIILVALIAVAAIGVVRTLQKNVNVQLANVANSLSGNTSVHERKGEVTGDDMLKRKDFSNFMNGAISREQ